MTTETIESTNTDIKVEPPKFYKVLLHNDDITTMDFVVAVLQQIFHRTYEEAIEITESIHFNGEGIAGAPYTREIAEEKANETKLFATKNGFPLVASFEEL
jgi:ATP-dependent Clp protease adaptor protein ClpS